jgi:ankyrin repeat protein
MKLAIILVVLIATFAVATHGHAQGVVERRAEPQTPTELFPPLMRAAEAGNPSDVRRLLKEGVDVNEKLDGIGLTALMLAAGRGHLEVVKVLLEAGADPNAAGGATHVGFFTPLTMAMARRNKNRIELIDTLIAGGAFLNPPQWFPQSPLFAAVNDNDIEMINELLKRGSDVNWENGIGSTALVSAITLGEPNVEVVRLLLNAGANPNKPRLWIGNDCVSILKSLDEVPGMPKNKVREEIRRLIIRAGGKKYSTKSYNRPCKQ